MKEAAERRREAMRAMDETWMAAVDELSGEAARRGLARVDFSTKSRMIPSSAQLTSMLMATGVAS
jgi:hypothetical protein